MTRDKFESEINRWVADLLDEVFRLHDNGVQAEACLNIAIQIATSKAAKRAIDRQQLGIGSHNGLSLT